MAKCRAMVMLQPGKLEMQQVEIPRVAEDCALVKVEACGICGTDKHCFAGHRTITPFPIIPGHEFIGTIVELGKEANNRMGVFGTPLAIGDRVSVAPTSMTCGHCYYCLARPQNPGFCTGRITFGYRALKDPPGLWGGFSEYVYVHPRSYVFKVPRDMPMKRAVLTEPLASSLRAVEMAYNPGEPFLSHGYGVGRSAMVIGAGPIGAVAVAALRHSGAGVIIAQDILPARLEMAKKMGADFVIDARLPLDERLKKVQQLTDGVGPDVVVEAAGVPIAFKEAVDFVRKGGKVIEMGNAANTGTTEFNPYMVCHKEIEIHGSWAAPAPTLKDALSMLERTSLPLEELVTHVLPLEDFAKGIEMTGSEKAFKVVIVPS